MDVASNIEGQYDHFFLHLGIRSIMNSKPFAFAFLLIFFIFYLFIIYVKAYGIAPSANVEKNKKTHCFHHSLESNQEMETL